MLRPRRSRLLTLWWRALHALLAAGFCAAALPALAKPVLVAVLIGHAVARAPAGSPPVLVMRRDGRWALPARGLTNLTLAPGSCCTSAWIRLVLAGGGAREAVLLVRDQFDPPIWRGLQAALRRL